MKDNKSFTKRMRRRKRGAHSEGTRATENFARGGGTRDSRRTTSGRETACNEESCDSREKGETKLLNVEKMRSWRESNDFKPAWLAGDPTVKKTTRGSVRRGVNVMNKSRMFEKDSEEFLIEEVGLHRGDVSNKE